MIKYRDVALDELHLAMKTYSTKLAACTPRDDQQVYMAYGGRDPIHARHAGTSCLSVTVAVANNY